MSAPPYMKLYWGDYFRDTRRLVGAREHGAYLLLLGEMWTQGGSLPVDDEILARLALCSHDEWAQIAPAVLSFFKTSRGKLTQKRLTAELSKYDDTIRKRKEAGKRGGLASHGKDSGNGPANAKQKAPYPEPEPEPVVRTLEDKSSKAPEASPDPDKLAWTVGLDVLTTQGGMTEKAARAFFGRLISQNGLEARDLLPAASQAKVGQTRDPQGYLTKAAQGVATRRAPVKKAVGFV